MKLDKWTVRFIIAAVTLIGLSLMGAPSWAAVGFGLVIAYLAIPEAPR